MYAGSDGILFFVSAQRKTAARYGSGFLMNQ